MFGTTESFCTLTVNFDGPRLDIFALSNPLQRRLTVNEFSLGYCAVRTIMSTRVAIHNQVKGRVGLGTATPKMIE